MDLPLLVDQSKGVNTEALHVPVILGDADIVVEPSEGVETLRQEGTEVEEPPILLDVGFRVGLKGVDHIRELDRVPDEEHREVVPHHIKVSLSGVKLDGKSSGVPDRFRAAALMDDGGEPNDDGRLNSGSPKEISTGEVRNIMSHLEESLGACTSSVDDTLRDPLAREIGKLLYEMVIFKEHWTCCEVPEFDQISNTTIMILISTQLHA